MPSHVRRPPPGPTGLNSVRVPGRVFEFIEGVRLGGDPSARVLVHCNQGVSRSASCVIFWLMQRERCGFDAALRRVQGCREVAHPNSSFERHSTFHQRRNASNCGFNLSS